MNKFTRRTVIAAACAAAAMTFGPMSFAQQAPEKKDVTIAVGGKSLYYYLPLSIAEQLGYFKDEGLNVKIVDFQGGSRSLQAVVGGSADVVSGAFEHTISMQAKKQPMTAFVLQGRAPQLALVVSNKTMKDYKQLSDLKGKKVGVTAPGSSSQMVANFILKKGGLGPKDVAFIGVGSSSGAVSAIRSGQIDALKFTDVPFIIRERSWNVAHRETMFFFRPMIAVKKCGKSMGSHREKGLYCMRPRSVPCQGTILKDMIWIGSIF